MSDYDEQVNARYLEILTDDQIAESVYQSMTPSLGHLIRQLVKQDKDKGYMKSETQIMAIQELMNVVNDYVMPVAVADVNEARGM